RRRGRHRRPRPRPDPLLRRAGRRARLGGRRAGQEPDAAAAHPPRLRPAPLRGPHPYRAVLVEVGMNGPVLVTGLPRSGTSWVGKMLAAGGGLVYVNEPLNPQRPPGRSPGVLDATVTHRFQYICRDNEHEWLRAFTDTVALRYRFRAELRRNRAPSDLARMIKYGSAFTVGRLTGRRALLDDPF